MSQDIDIKEKKDVKKPDPKKRGLGRGLNALFEDDEDDFVVQPPVASAQVTENKENLMLGVDQLEPGKYQPRRDFTAESIAELADSIAEHGVLQPLLVRPKPGFSDVYEIIAGERRWRAAQQAQLHQVPVIIKKISDEKALEVGLIENLQREDLNPVEEAQGYKQLMEEFGHTQEKAAKALGKSRSHVANTLRLLNLPAKILSYLKSGQLSAGHARALITAENPEQLADMIVNQKLSVRDIEDLVGGKAVGGKSKGSKGKPEKDVDTLALEDEMTNNLGMKVVIDVKKDAKGNSAGTFKVKFKDLDQLDELLRRLSQNNQ